MAWELGLGYAANGLSIAAVFAENDGAAVAGESDITASYDLGGGMSINAAKRIWCILHRFKNVILI